MTPAEGDVREAEALRLCRAAVEARARLDAHEAHDCEGKLRCPTGTLSADLAADEEAQAAAVAALKALEGRTK